MLCQHRTCMVLALVMCSFHAYEVSSVPQRPGSSLSHPLAWRALVVSPGTAMGYGSDSGILGMDSLPPA